MKDFFKKCDYVEFGFSDAVQREILSLLEFVGIYAMHPEEQALFLLELGRLVHDRYQHLSRNQGARTPPLAYEEVVRMTCAEFVGQSCIVQGG